MILLERQRGGGEIKVENYPPEWKLMCRPLFEYYIEHFTL